jgi:heme-degrading monooxygenase HmoA
MYARLTTTAVPASTEPFSVGAVVEHVLPTLRELDGFRGLLVLRAVDGSSVVSVSLWESAEAMAASEDVSQKMRAAETASRGLGAPEAAAFKVDALRLNP